MVSEWAKELLSKMLDGWWVSGVDTTLTDMTTRAPAVPENVWNTERNVKQNMAQNRVTNWYKQCAKFALLEALFQVVVLDRQAKVWLRPLSPLHPFFSKLARYSSRINLGQWTVSTKAFMASSYWSSSGIVCGRALSWKVSSWVLR